MFFPGSSQILRKDDVHGGSVCRKKVSKAEEIDTQSAENLSNCVPTDYVNQLPDYVLELIFTFVNPYQDYDNSRLVCKRWNRVAHTALQRIKRIFFQKCNNFTWRLIEEQSVGHGHVLTERCSHSACYHPADQAMFMFGGCTSSYTAFNDLWIFKLSTREWDRVIISRPPLPSAKALASLVLYNDNLILYGGFSKSSMNPIHQTTTFYKEIHLFNKVRNCWEEIICENTAPHLAGHTASIVADFMLVFGGSMGSSYNNNVYVLDIARRIWNMPCIPGPCPPASLWPVPNPVGREPSHYYWWLWWPKCDVQ